MLLPLLPLLFDAVAASSAAANASAVANAAVAVVASAVAFHLGV